MITLFVVAVGLIAIAAMLGVRFSPSSRRSADQRGEIKISLQALLIAGFSLLLLVQVASALVIIVTDDDGGSSSSQQAATSLPPARPASDGETPAPVGTTSSTTSTDITTAADPDDENTATTASAPVSNPCQSWEVFDPDTADAGFGGPAGLGGIWSSLIGCVRVCYAQTYWGAGTRLPPSAPPYRFANEYLAFEERGQPRLDEDGDPLLDENGNPLPLYGLVLEYSLTDIRLEPEEDQNSQYATYQIVSSTQAGYNLDTTQNAGLDELVTVVEPGEEIRVSESQDACEHIHTDTGTLFVDSNVADTLREPPDPDNPTN